MVTATIWMTPLRSGRSMFGSLGHRIPDCAFGISGMLDVFRLNVVRKMISWPLGFIVHTLVMGRHFDRWDDSPHLTFLRRQLEHPLDRPPRLTMLEYSH